MLEDLDMYLEKGIHVLNVHLSKVTFSYFLKIQEWRVFFSVNTQL